MDELHVRTFTTHELQHLYQLVNLGLMIAEALNKRDEEIASLVCLGLQVRGDLEMAA